MGKENMISLNDQQRMNFPFFIYFVYNIVTLFEIILILVEKYNNNIEPHFGSFCIISNFSCCSNNIFDETKGKKNSIPYYQKPSEPKKQPKGN